VDDNETGFQPPGPNVDIMIIKGGAPRISREDCSKRSRVTRVTGGRSQGM
jgi:hypothetical protein